MSEKALSKAVFWAMLVVHGALGFVLLVILVWFVPKFEGVFARMHERGELPAVTTFTLTLSNRWYWLFPFGFALDAAVLFALGRLPSKRGWLVTAWFVFASTAIGLLTCVVVYGLLAPVLNISDTITI